VAEERCVKRIIALGSSVAFLTFTACSGSGSSPRTTRTTAPASTTTKPPAPCTGVRMTKGQPDIDAAPEGTRFCLSGTHNWTLTPKNGDSFIGPAILDGHGSVVRAFVGSGTSNVTLANLEVRNYAAGNQEAAISAHGTNGWKFLNLRVHDNGTNAGGTGANLGVDSLVRGGRYYNNRTLGIGGGGGANGWVIDGAEIDHNNFADDSYTKRNTSCGYEGGGVKWTAQDVTVKNSYVHDNACKGLWADLNANGATITHTRIADNWDEGIFIEISSGATITDNTITGNGTRNYNSGSKGCSWLWGGGITLASSGDAVIARNVLIDNCNGITGTQQNRSDGKPGLLEHLNIVDNSVSGKGKSGVGADNGANLASRRITFSGNSFANDATLIAIPGQ
jgi:parallel beta-helix repeat protein